MIFFKKFKIFYVSFFYVIFLQYMIYVLEQKVILFNFFKFIKFFVFNLKEILINWAELLNKINFEKRINMIENFYIY